MLYTRLSLCSSCNVHSCVTAADNYYISTKLDSSEFFSSDVIRIRSVLDIIQELKSVDLFSVFQCLAAFSPGSDTDHEVCISFSSEFIEGYDLSSLDHLSAICGAESHILVDSIFADPEFRNYIARNAAKSLSLFEQCYIDSGTAQE